MPYFQTTFLSKPRRGLLYPNIQTHGLSAICFACVSHMRRFVGGEGVSQVGAEGVFVCFACIAVQPGRDVQRDFEAVGLIQQAADGGGCFGQCATEACSENAFDNEVVTCFQSAKPACGTAFQLVGADKADAV